MNEAPKTNWQKVKCNATYFSGAVTAEEGGMLRWHSPSAENSSQIFCISAFGSLRTLPDGQALLSSLITQALGHIPPSSNWTIKLEYEDAHLLGETAGVRPRGQSIVAGTPERRQQPTSIDAFASSPEGVVCIESKFDSDALKGFGSCSQLKKRKTTNAAPCGGYYGPGSDRETPEITKDAPCRLAAPIPGRGARRYWEAGRKYFRDDVFALQAPLSAASARTQPSCPLAGPNFQAMRNFLFAAEAACGRPFGVIAMAPEAISTARGRIPLKDQVADFQANILRPEYQRSIAFASYETLIELLNASRHEETRRLGEFLSKRISAVAATRSTRARRNVGDH